MSILKFIGTGSAFNTKLGNNGAFYRDGNTLIMFDCGSSTYSRIVDKLDDIDHIHVIMTHTHPDHCGSLGDLIFHMYYSKQPMFVPKVTVYSPQDVMICDILKLMGVSQDKFHYKNMSKGVGKIETDTRFYAYPVKVRHAKELSCYGYIMNIGGKVVYYSGDSYMIPEVILEMLNDGEIDYFYQDACKADYDGNVHLSLRKLTKLVNEDVRDKVYCMHLDSTFDREESIKLGFNVVEVSNTL